MGLAYGIRAFGAQHYGGIDMAVILDGRDAYKSSLELFYATTMRTAAQRQRVIVKPLADIAANLPALRAYINHGRLLVDCPDCGGAEFVWASGPFQMMCRQCWNIAIGGRWRMVDCPPDLDSIAEALGQRPLARHRNWLPGETVESLRLENLSHGIGG